MGRLKQARKPRDAIASNLNTFPTDLELTHRATRKCIWESKIPDKGIPNSTRFPQQSTQRRLNLRFIALEIQFFDKGFVTFSRNDFTRQSVNTWIGRILQYSSPASEIQFPAKNCWNKHWKKKTKFESQLFFPLITCYALDKLPELYLLMATFMGLFSLTTLHLFLAALFLALCY